MKIAIIGGGWVGCHLAKKLKDEHQITIFDKNDSLFSETSYNNQNRLHYGFHYARSYKTRELCKNTFQLFINEYGFLTKEIDNNLYCIPEKESYLDYETYLIIFDNFKNKKSNIKFNKISGCIETNERYIDFKKAKEFFTNELKNFFIQKYIKKDEIEKLKNEYDLVINATNNIIKNDDCVDSFYELTISLLYKKIKSTKFGALTLVDGELFSIYPYDDNLYTVTDVKYTPLKKFKSIKQLEEYRKGIDKDLIIKRKNLIEKRIINYYPEFLEDFEFDNFFISIKSKVKNTSDERYPIISLKNNIINCFTGKIQGIYLIENNVKEYMKFYEKR